MSTEQSTKKRELTPDELSVLLKAYELDRTDDIGAGHEMHAVLATALGLMTLLGFAAVQFNDLPGWIVALAPFPPLPFMAFAAMYSRLAEIRGTVVDRYEQELRDRFPDLTAAGLPVLAGHTVLGHLWSTVYGRGVTAIMTVTWLALYAAVVVESFRYARRTEPVLAWISVSAASAGILAVIALWSFVWTSARYLESETSRLKGEEEPPRAGGPRWGKTFILASWRRSPQA